MALVHSCIRRKKGGGELPETRLCELWEQDYEARSIRGGKAYEMTPNLLAISVDCFEKRILAVQEEKAGLFEMVKNKNGRFLKLPTVIVVKE